MRLVAVSHPFPRLKAVVLSDSSSRAFDFATPGLLTLLTTLANILYTTIYTPVDGNLCIALLHQGRRILHILSAIEGIAVTTTKALRRARIQPGRSQTSIMSTTSTTVRTKPSDYKSFSFHAVRTISALCTIIVMAILIFFTIALKTDGYKIPWTFLIVSTSPSPRENYC